MVSVFSGSMRKALNHMDSGLMNNPLSFPLKIAEKYNKFFSHPDCICSDEARNRFTVGSGITPDRPIWVRGLYRRLGISPCPEELLH
jgi:hypothetical protein